MDKTRASAQMPARPRKPAASKTLRSECVDGGCTGVLALHEAFGNTGLLRLMRSGQLRAKRQISIPGDPWEQEAERVAATILSQPPKAVAHRACTCGTHSPCEACQEEPVFRKSAGQISSSSALQGEVETVTGSSGERLDESTREFFEERFDQNFDDVRVHTGWDAAESATALAADAYTVGANIVFGHRQYAPGTSGGRHLLAHELTHVVQQRYATEGTPSTILRQPTQSEPFRLDTPDPATENVSRAEPPEPEPEPESNWWGGPLEPKPEPENTWWGVSEPDLPENVCRAEGDLVCEREGDPEPLGRTIEFEDTVFAANADYLDWLLRREVRLFGLDQTEQLVRRFLLTQGVLISGALMPPVASDEADHPTLRALRRLEERLFPEIALAVNDAFVRVKRYVNSYLTSYNRAAETNLLTLLARSEARVDAERIRYGLQSKADILHFWSPLRIDAENRRNPTPEDAVPALKELATAARILWGLKLQLEIARAQTTTIRVQSAAAMLGTKDIGTFQSASTTYSVQTAHIADESRLYEFQKAELTERYPVLAAYESDSVKLKMLADGSAVQVIVELHEKMNKILTNIASVRDDVNDHDVNIWKLPRLISATNLSLRIREDSLEDALIKQKVEEENDESFWTSIGLAVAQVGLVLLAPVTGGLSLIAAAALSAGMLVKSVETYNQQSALAGTDFDRALAIAAEEPSLFWVAMDVVLFIPDGVAALKAFRTIKTLLADYRAAKSVDEAAEALSRLERAAAADGGKAFAERMVGGAKAGKYPGLTHLFNPHDAEALAAAGEAAARAVSGPVLLERATIAGTLKITQGGHMVLCSSPCRWLREVFAAALTQNADLEARLARIEQEVQTALARADHASVAALGIQTQTLMRDLVKETVGDLALNPAQLTVLKDIEGALDLRGLDWTDLGFRDRSELVEVLNTPGRADDVLARLRHRAETAGPRATAPPVAAPSRVTSKTITVEKDIDELIEPARPRLNAPPTSVTTPEDLVMWERYSAYFDERVASMRKDLKRLGWTERMPPHGFDRFRQVYTENPELLDALRGRLAQGRTGNVLDELTSGTAAQNLGLSKVQQPIREEVVYGDFVLKTTQKDRYLAISSKSRVIAENTSPAELWRVVRDDIREGLEKYYGLRYVRRPGLDVSGKQILIDELVINYDLNQVPAKFRERMRTIAKAYEGVNVKIGFFVEP